MSRAVPSHFQTREAELREQLANLHPEAVRRQREKLEQALNDLRNASTREPKVSDHALLRYCERVMGADLNDIRDRILREIGPAVAVVGNGKFPITGGAVAVVRESTVVTILNGEGQRE